MEEWEYNYASSNVFMYNHAASTMAREEVQLWVQTSGNEKKVQVGRVNQSFFHLCLHCWYFEGSNQEHLHTLRDCGEGLWRETGWERVFCLCICNICQISLDIWHHNISKVEAERRLVIHRERLANRGIMADTLTHGWCRWALITNHHQYGFGFRWLEKVKVWGSF